MAISFKEYAPDQYVVTPQETLPGMMQSLIDQEEEEEEAEDTIFELGSDRMTLEFSSSCTQVGATCSSDDSQNFNGTAATFSTSPVHLSNGPVHPLSAATCDQFIAAEEEPPVLNPPCELTGFYQDQCSGAQLGLEPSFTDHTATWNIMSNSSINMISGDGYETAAPRSFANPPDFPFFANSIAANFVQSHEQLDRQLYMVQNGAEEAVSGRAAMLHQLFAESRKRAQLGSSGMQLSASLLDEVAAQAKARLEVKKLRRMESNRASARRSRKRKADSLDSLHIENVRLREEYVPHILQEKHEVEKRLKESETKIIKLEKEKVELSEQIQRLTQQKLGTSCAPHAAGGSAAAVASSVTFPMTHHVVV
ncbi:unnamed protein product [Sphagnum troendelagicum]|uniref:BZIP domain-containing protein n=1 Tax=Sphagnum troendelagicum TaxID=128251 RepID=A0ABP0URP5_9BRYO